MNRAEMRRQAKDKAKIAHKLSKAAPWMEKADVAMKVDYTYERVKELNQKNIEQIQKHLADVCSQELLKAEQYMMLGDVLISLKALEMTFGELKTVQKGMNKFLQNFDRAMEYIDSHGIKESYHEMQERYGLNDMTLDDDYDITCIQDIWKNKEQTISAIVWEVWKNSSAEIDRISQEVDAL